VITRNEIWTTMRYVFLSWSNGVRAKTRFTLVMPMEIESHSLLGLVAPLMQFIFERDLANGKAKVERAECGFFGPV